MDTSFTGSSGSGSVSSQPSSCRTRSWKALRLVAGLPRMPAPPRWGPRGCRDTTRERGSQRTMAAVWLRRSFSRRRPSCSKRVFAESEPGTRAGDATRRRRLSGAARGILGRARMHDVVCRNGGRGAISARTRERWGDVGKRTSGRSGARSCCGDRRIAGLAAIGVAARHAGGPSCRRPRPRTRELCGGERLQAAARAHPRGPAGLNTIRRRDGAYKLTVGPRQQPRVCVGDPADPDDPSDFAVHRDLCVSEGVAAAGGARVRAAESYRQSSCAIARTQRTDGRLRGFQGRTRAAQA